MMLRLFKIALLGLALCLSAVLRAGDELQNDVLAEGISQQSMRYFDGRHWRTVWVNPHEVAELVAGEGSDGLLRSLAPAARLVQQGRKFRIWTIDPAVLTTAAATRRLNSTGSSRFAPVFQLSASGGSRMVLSGNVIVRFKQNMEQPQLLDWARQHDLQSMQKMSIPATYLFYAGQGMQALEKAAQIQAGGEVRFAVPEWWRQAYKR